MFTRGMIFPGGREPILQGDGVWLRYPQMSDYTQWAQLRDESREFLAPWEPTWAGDELSRAAFRRRLRRYQREIRNDLAYPFLLFRRPGDALMGGCTLSNVRRGVTQSAAAAPRLGGRHARHGHLFPPLSPPVPFAFGGLGLPRLEAARIPHNTPSRALLLKL